MISFDQSRMDIDIGDVEREKKIALVKIEKSNLTNGSFLSANDLFGKGKNLLP